MDIKAGILKEMRKPELYKEHVLKYVEDNIADAFNYACRNNLSINEWQPDSRFGKMLNEKTTLITVRMFDLWENAIVETIKRYIKEKFSNIPIERVTDAIGDLSIAFHDPTLNRWEIKTTQGQNSFSGATHASSKCNNYILVSYALNKDKKLKLEGNRGIITELAVFVWDGMEAKFSGKPTKKSSWTTLKISAKIAKKRPEIVVIGKLNPKQKWCEIIREKLV